MLQHACDAESARNLVAAHQLRVIAGRPSEQREVVQHRVWKVAQIAVLQCRLRAVSLAELRPVRAEYQRQVHVVRSGDAKGIV